MNSTTSLSGYINNFYDRRLLTIFLFGLSSGFPWVMIGSAMSAWLKDEGYSRASIGYFGVVFAAYSINFLWSPLIDRIKLPLLTPLLGQRRSWILLMQAGVFSGCLLLVGMDVANDFAMAGMAALLISFSSATQDITIDAYRIDIIAPTEQQQTAAAAAMATSGWWTGYAGLGAITFFLADIDGWGWPQVYSVLAVIMACLIMVTLWAKEPESQRDKMQHQLEADYQKKLAAGKHRLFPGKLNKALIWLTVTVAEPIKEFFTRNGFKLAISLLLFVLLFKIGEAFLGRMSITFYQEMGFSNSDIAFYSKTIGWSVTILCAPVSSLFIIRLGIVKGLFIGGIAMAASNLMFAAMSMVGPDKLLFAATVIVDGFTSAWATVAFVAFISMLCNRSFTASQYALLASLGTLGRTFLGSSSGVLVDYLNGNWALFFVLTTLMVIPSLIILYFLRNSLNALESGQRSSPNGHIG